MTIALCSVTLQTLVFVRLNTIKFFKKVRCYTVTTKMCNGLKNADK
jgi:hypothetical protein